MIIFGTIITTWIALGLTLPFFKKYFLAKREIRGINNEFIPQGGGIIFAIVASFFSFKEGSIIPTICLLVAFVGLFDDKYKLPIIVRYIFQFILLILLMYSQDIFLKLFFSNIYLNSFLYFLIIISGTAFINFTNFMDGIDGLVSFCFCLILLFVLSFTYPQIAIVSYALIGFIPWNFYPAKIFMGDAGSTFLGAIYVSALFACANYTQLFFVLFVASPLLGDALFCIFRRIYYKQNILKTHKLHLYQRLCKAGISHKNVTFVYGLAIFLVGMSTLFNDLKVTMIIIIFELVVAYWMDKNIAYPFEVALKEEINL